MCMADKAKWEATGSWRLFSDSEIEQKILTFWEMNI